MNSRKTAVLVVEDDPDLRASITVFLKRDPAYDVSEAADGREAIDILSRKEIAFVISDIRMPHVSGLALFSEIRNRFPQIGVILMTGFDVENLRSKLEVSSFLRLVEKPVSPERLKRIIDEQIEIASSGFTGTLTNIGLTDLIQMCCMAMVNMVIRVRNGSEDGDIYIRNGEIIHAQCGDLAGEEAFYRILSWKDGRFETLAGRTFPEPTIRQSWEYLLMEGARMIDESEMSAGDEIEVSGESDDSEDYWDIGDLADPEEEPLLLTEEIGRETESLPEKEIKLLIVDDSPVMCKALTRMLSGREGIRVVGTAGDGSEALELIETLRPDIITLDVNMPVMSGDTTLKHIMIKTPCPVVIVSNPSDHGRDRIIEFLLLGAVDFISKPGKSAEIERKENEIVEKVRIAANARIGRYTRIKSPRVTAGETPPAPSAPAPFLAVVGAGACGYPELIRLITGLPAEMEGAVMAVLKTSPDFITPMADYIARRSRIRVLPAAPGPLLSGSCYLADDRMGITLSEDGARLEASAGSPDAFDRLLDRAAGRFASAGSTILLTGTPLGDISGLHNFKAHQGSIIVRDPAGSMAPDLLEQVIREGLADHVADPAALPDLLAGRMNRN